MLSFEEVGEILDDIADSLPLELYRELNGGIQLKEEISIHPKAVDNDLYILGVYRRDSLGKSIKIYYGSFVRVFPHISKERAKIELEKILVHELRHHNEYLSGIDDLIYYDHDRINEYLERKERENRMKK